MIIIDMNIKKRLLGSFNFDSLLFPLVIAVCNCVLCDNSSSGTSCRHVSSISLLVLAECLSNVLDRHVFFQVLQLFG